MLLASELVHDANCSNHAGAIDFNQWWNVATTYSQDAILTFAEMLDSSGIKAFIFAQAPFFPLNGQLLGAANPSANNRYFTIEVSRQWHVETGLCLTAMVADRSRLQTGRHWSCAMGSSVTCLSVDSIAEVPNLRSCCMWKY